MSMKLSTSSSNINRTWFLVKSSFNGEWTVHQGDELLGSECEETRQLVKQTYSNILIGENEQNAGMIRVFDLEDDIDFLRSFLMSLPNVYTGFNPEIEEGLFWGYCNDWITPTPLCDPYNKRQILSCINGSFLNCNFDIASKTVKVLKARSMGAGCIVHYDRAYD